MANEKEATLVLRIKQVGQEALASVSDGLKNIAKVSMGMAVAVAGAIAAGVAAFKEEELAINRLNQAMVNNGDFTSEASKDLTDFASKLQKTSTIGDEVAISMLALAKGFGVSNDEAKKMVQAAADLSAATGMDLESAMKQLGATLSGTTGRLGMMIPSMKDLTEEQLKSGSAIDLVSEKFKGSAEATISGLGALDQLKNTLGDFVELIGKAAAPFIVYFSKQLSDMTNDVNGADSTMQSLNTTAEFIAKTFSVVKNIVMGLGAAIGTGLAAAVESVTLLAQGQFIKAKDAYVLGFEELGLIAKERAQITADELDAIDQVREQQDIDRKMREEQLLAQSNANKMVLAKKHNADLKLEKDKQAMEDAKRENEAQKFRVQMAQQQVSVATATANLLTAVLGSQNKAAFVIAKGAAIAQSIVQTYLSATAAFASQLIPGDPTSLARAGAAAGYAKTAGFINTAAIAASAIQGLAEGGVVKARPGGIIANIGEGGQDEAVIPLDKMGMMGGVTINLNGPVLGDREQARQFAIEIDRQLLELRRNNESVAFDSSVS